MELAALVVAALVDMIVFVLAATSWGIYIAMFRDFPICYSVRTTRLVVLLSVAKILLRQYMDSDTHIEQELNKWRKLYSASKATIEMLYVESE